MCIVSCHLQRLENSTDQVQLDLDSLGLECWDLCKSGGRGQLSIWSNHWRNKGRNARKPTFKGWKDLAMHEFLMRVYYDKDVRIENLAKAVISVLYQAYGHDDGFIVTVYDGRRTKVDASMEPETFFDNEDILRFNWTVDGQHIVAVRIESQLGYQCISERQINKTIINTLFDVGFEAPGAKMRRGTKDIKYLGDIPPVVNQFGMTHQVSIVIKDKRQAFTSDTLSLDAKPCLHSWWNDKYQVAIHSYVLPVDGLSRNERSMFNSALELFNMTRKVKNDALAHEFYSRLEWMRKSMQRRQVLVIVQDYTSDIKAIEIFTNGKVHFWYPRHSVKNLGGRIVNILISKKDSEMPGCFQENYLPVDLAYFEGAIETELKKSSKYVNASTLTEIIKLQALNMGLNTHLVIVADGHNVEYEDNLNPSCSLKHQRGAWHVLYYGTPNTSGNLTSEASTSRVHALDPEYDYQYQLSAF